MEVVVRSDIQPGVIDMNIIQEAVKEQGPKGEAGKLIEEEGYDLKEIGYLRLEFLNILRIDHLWMMTGLTKLQLGNNIIEKIENLETLVNLRELDLSFNRIKVIENLENLGKVETLTLFQNCIKKVENLDCLKKLEIFSIGNNDIEDERCVLYLRNFKNLKSLNMAGNPCAHEGFREYVAAFIPQLVYYEYRLLTEKEIQLARSKYLKDLEQVEKEEGIAEAEERKACERRTRELLHSEAFVEQMDGDQLSEAMFSCDPSGRALQLMDEEAEELFSSFQEQVRSVTTEIFNLGQQQLKLRNEEIQQFMQCVQQAKSRSQKKSQQIVEEFTTSKNQIFVRVQELMAASRENEADKESIAVTIGAKITEFHDLCQKTWKSLMGIELVLFEQFEELNVEFEKNLEDMVTQFIEEAQVHFTLIREHENIFSQVLKDLAMRFLTHLTSRRDDLSMLPSTLQEIMTDKETLAAALAVSHDLHLQVIDNREDQLITRVRGWHRDLCDDLQTEEISRNRATVLEINHFLDIQKEEFDLFNLDLGDDDFLLGEENIVSSSTPRSGSLTNRI
ncbi:dynein regulatory complex subunit 3-like isoform X1 [Macrosteles quadrilineatus]|uniref:dynein regulatory complex subunit 3-like isoform X1 n=1 Tax=Macrosteles quadrilineatus TaxID=74068 RepID=UPI0023E13B64|nr:dynein regulatory complex subunit 3-like isoform X1 [Macrosteles quadrilineatus]